MRENGTAYVGPYHLTTYNSAALQPCDDTVMANIRCAVILTFCDV